LGVIEICGLAADSRAIEPGWVFFAVPGNTSDGLAFIDQAIAKGAVAIVSERQPAMPTGCGTAFILVDDVRHALARAAAAFYPTQPETIVAITGTSGKTSVAAFCRQIWAQLGRQAASLGTLGIVAPDGAVYGSLTTPDPVALQKSLDQLARGGVTHLALEASSHGIEQKRLDGVKLSAGAFTNLSRDHLDYHGTLAAYLKAKLRLFETLLAPGQPAVINADSDAAAEVFAACKARGLEIISVGRAGRRLRLVDVKSEDLAVALTLEVEGRPMRTRLPLAGDFQISNALVAAGLCIATGGAPDAVLAALETLEGAPGRMQLVGRRGTASVFVDYAHKPDALDKVLTTLRPLATGRLVAIFGCGGDRDQGKRPIMGAIAARLADRVIVTDDNPRSEEPRAIRAAVLAGTRGGSAEIVENGDRAAAIDAAVASLAPGDVLVIAGKGHETGQIIGDTVLPFSDLDCAISALQNHPA
jgi:UDP-N-acetylmuramoyl-L-alanyl-D-glutamate--2,6-diaminopimelate ligase